MSSELNKIQNIYKKISIRKDRELEDKQTIILLIFNFKKN